MRKEILNCDVDTVITRITFVRIISVIIIKFTLRENVLDEQYYANT